jgi:hypothetical protein
MPIFPFTAIGVASLWDAALERGRDRRIVVGAVWLLVLVGGLFWATAAFLGAQYPGPFRAAGPILAIPGGVLVAGAVVVLVLAVRGATLGAFAALCATMAIAWVALLTWAMPLVEDQKPIRPLAAAIVAALSPGDRIVAYGMSTATSLIYYTHHPVVWADTEKALRTALCAPGRVFLVITDGELAKLRWTPPPLEAVAERAGTRVWLKFPSVTCRSAGGGKRRALASGRFGGVLAARAGGGPGAPAALGERAEHAVVVRFPHEVVGTLAEHVSPSS